MGNNEDKDVVSLAEVLRICRRRVWVIALAAVVFLGFGVGYGAVKEPTYTATGLILIRQAQSDDPNRGAQGIQFEVEGLKAITPTMARTVTSRPVLEDAIGRLGSPVLPQELTDRLVAEPVADTQFISVSYSDTSPQRAQRVVNTICDVASEHLSDLDLIATPINAVVYERAVVPSEPVGLSAWIIGSLALVTGLVFGLLAAFALEGLDKAGLLGKDRGKW